MTQITLRKVPDELARRLKEAAECDGKSMNRLALELLAEQLGVAPSKRRKRRDLSRFADLWNEADAAEFAANTACFDKIDQELWQ
jgi:plasmid stability protein